MLCNKDTAKDTGLNIWVDGDPDDSGSKVDIIAVQGLGANKYYTWVKKKSSGMQPEKSRLLSGSDFISRRRKIAETPEYNDAAQSSNTARTAIDSPVEIMWLRDLLPRFLPNARIATYSYESDWRQDVKTNLRKCGQQLLNVLYQHRSSEEEAQRPLILIGHSLGGVVIKQALVLANHSDILKGLRLSIAGIIFLGTPHQGSDAAGYGKLLARATGRDTTLLESLTRNSQVLHEIAQDFETSYSNADLVCFYEEKHNLLGVKIVDLQSASLNNKRSIYLTTDHSGLNKFHGYEDENFQLVIPEIQRMAQTAQISIENQTQTSTTNPSIKPFCVNFSLKGIPVLNSFVSRDVEMARLAKIMLPSSADRTRRKTCVLHGLGGIGKTQLAIEFARTYRQKYSAVFWIDGSSKEKLKQSIANLSNQISQYQLLERAKLYAQRPHKELDGAVEDVLFWFSQPSNDQWLLIYDNVDRELSAGSGDSESFSLMEYLPEADQGYILITSRLTSLLNFGGADIRVGAVSESQGENILTNSIGEPVKNAKELISLLQGLPLAINQAGTYMRTTGTSVLAYIKSYNETWRNLMESQHQFASQGPLDRSVLTTWTLLFRRLEERNGPAAKLLILWGFLDNRDIWYDLFKSALTLEVASELPTWYTDCVDDYSNFIECTNLFVLYSFIDVKMESSSFSVHPVLHQWCFQASEENMAEMAWLAFVVVASSAPHWRMMDRTLIQRRLLPHCYRLSFLLRETIPKAPYEEISSLDIACHIVGDLYTKQDILREGEDMYVRALAGKEKALGPKHTSTLDTVINLGNLYKNQDKFREAENMYGRALAGYEKDLGPGHTSTLSTVTYLGTLYSKLDKLREAEDMYVRALAGYEKALGPELTSTLRTVLDLGNLYRDQGKLREAEEMYVRAMAGYEKALGPEHTSTLDTVLCLGILYHDQGKLREAEDMYVRALAGFEKALGPEHTSTLKTVNNLGMLYRNQGKLREAEDMYVRAMAGYEKALGPEHTSTLRTVLDLGNLYRDQGKLREAEEMYVRAMAGYEKALGPEHTSTLDTVLCLGILYHDQGRLREAEDMYVRAMAGYEKALGPEHTSTLRTVLNLGNLYTGQGKLREAEEMYVRAMAGYEKALGPEHTSTLNSVLCLGMLYKQQDKLREAEDMYVRALAGYEKALGPEHISTLGAMGNLGNLYRQKGKLREAEDMYLRILAGYEKALGPEHTSTLQTVLNLGILYSQQGKLREAEDMYVRASAGYEKALGPEHTSTLNSVLCLGMLYKQQDKLREAEDMYVRALAGYEKALGPEHISTLGAMGNLGNLYRQKGKLREAEDMYLRILAGYEKALGPEHTSTLQTVLNLGILYSQQGKLREAEDMYVRASAGYEKALGPEHTSTLNSVLCLGMLYKQQDKLREAEDMYVRASAGYEKALGPEHTSTLRTVRNLGILYHDQGKLREAEDMYVRALAGFEKALGPEHTSTLYTVNNLGTLYRNQRKLREAEDMYVRAMAGYEKALGPEHTSTLRTVRNLGILYHDQGKLREAEDMYVRALAGFEKALGPEHHRAVMVRRNIALLKNTPQSKTQRIMSRLFKKDKT